MKTITMLLKCNHLMPPKRITKENKAKTLNPTK